MTRSETAPASRADPPGRPSVFRVRGYLLAFAAVQRLAYGLEAGALPFGEAQIFDSAVYAHQAAAIRAGHFDDATLVAFGPLYGWFLAAVGDAWLPAQLAMGVATALLIERIAARHSPEAGLVGLALFIGYALPLSYETKMLSEPLGLFLLTGAVWLLQDREARPTWMLGGGVTLAFAVLARANLLFAVPFFIVAAAARRRGPEAALTRGARARAAAWVALGVALVLTANGIWNLAWFDRFVPVILVSRTASIASAQGEWTGSLAALSSGGAPSAWDVVRQAEQSLAQDAPSQSVPDVDVAGWLRSAPSKLATTFSDVETRYQYGFYGERTEMRSLSWPPLSMGTLLALGLLGAALLARRHGIASWIEHAPLILGVVIVTTLFHPSSRYRLSMIVPLISLGAIGLVELARLEHRRWRLGLSAALLVIAVGLGLRHLTHPLANPAMWHVQVAEAEYARGDVDASRARLARAMALSREGDDARAHIELLRRHRALPAP